MGIGFCSSNCGFVRSLAGEKIRDEKSRSSHESYSPLRAGPISTSSRPLGNLLSANLCLTHLSIYMYQYIQYLLEQYPAIAYPCKRYLLLPSVVLSVLRRSCVNGKSASTRLLVRQLMQYSAPHRMQYSVPH